MKRVMTRFLLSSSAQWCHQVNSTFGAAVAAGADDCATVAAGCARSLPVGAPQAAASDVAMAAPPNTPPNRSTARRVLFVGIAPYSLGCPHPQTSHRPRTAPTG